MIRSSAGLLMYRHQNGKLEVFLVHPGGPYWAKKDEGAWSIPKGEPFPGEDLLEAARRELGEETGFSPAGKFIPLQPVRQSGGKIVHAWAVRGDFDPGGLRSNTFSIEWPPRSGRLQTFPEVDRAEWFPIEIARKKILKSQTGFLNELESILARGDEDDRS